MEKPSEDSGDAAMCSTPSSVVISVSESWFLGGLRAYVGETNHIRIVFRVAGWPDAFMSMSKLIEGQIDFLGLGK